MGSTRYDCDCDCVIDMEALGVGVDEILQYARGVLGVEEVIRLIGGLQESLAERVREQVNEA